MVRNVGPPGSDRDFYQRGGWDSEGRNAQRFMIEPVQEDARAIPHEGNKYIAIESALRDLCHIDNFAILTIENGQFKTYSSPSLRMAEPSLFATNAENISQRSLQRFVSPAGYAQGFGRHENIQTYSDYDDTDSARRGSTDSSNGRRTGYTRHPKSEESEEDELCAKVRKRARGSYHPRHNTVPEDDTPIPIPISHKKQLRIADTAEVEKYFVQKCRDLQQAGCKIAAKTLIKVIEPKKQTNHPYTRGENSAPQWWPANKSKIDGVPHREPDHLLKPARVQLIVHILMLVTDPHAPNKTGHMRTITVDKLRMAVVESMSNWFKDKENPTNAAKEKFLKEIFTVARQRERLLNGEIDDSYTVSIAHGDSSNSTSDDEIDDGLAYQDEDDAAAAANELTPATSLPNTPDSLASTMHANSGILHSDPNNFAYSQRELPVRLYSQGHLPTPAEESSYATNDPMGVAQSSYLTPRPSLYSHPGTPLPDHSQHNQQQRRPNWQPAGFSSPQPNMGLFGSWPPPNNLMNNTSMPYQSYTTSAPPPGQTPVPYLPPPQAMMPPLQPPMHPLQGHQHAVHYGMNDGIARTFDSGGHGAGAATVIRTGSLSHPHLIGGQGHSFSEYLQEGGYGGHEAEMKDDQGGLVQGN